MTIKPAALFAPRWEVFWAATYNFELELFDEYLFRRLGDPPLNATILVDFEILAKTWQIIPLGEDWRARNANSLYLIRPAGRPQGRFHPKCYFFANRKEGILLVGSGNLSFQGLEEGHELFTRFDSYDPEGLAAISSWRDWMRRVVDETQDEVLGQRWFRLLQSTKDWLKPGSAKSSFVTNVESSLASKLTGNGQDVDELHVTAPYFDADLHALGLLIELTRPKAISVYLCRGASIDGKKLQALLKETKAKVRVLVFDPPRYVHAKLVALINGKSAKVLIGSANISRAGLTSSLNRESWANVEAGAIHHMSSRDAKALFTPPSLKLKEVQLASLDVYVLHDPEPSESRPLRLFSARPDDRRFIHLKFSGSYEGALLLSSDRESIPLTGTLTASPLSSGESTVLVWLSSPEGKALSNRVPLDDPVALLRQLEKATGKKANRPAEFESSDLQHPVVRIMVRLHNEYILDIEELDSISRIGGESEGDPSDPENTDFWERLARDELRVDPRSGSYRRLAEASPAGEDEVLLLLRLMLDRTPEERHLISNGDLSPINGSAKGHSWTPTQKLQVRLFNVLSRWARALADRRMDWIQPIASLRNFQAILYALAELWELQALSEPKLKQALGLILGSFVRSESASGYLFQIEKIDRDEALERLSQEARDVATALAFIGVRKSTAWQENVFEWQVWLKPCLDDEIIRASEAAANLAARILKEPVTSDQLAERLAWAADYIDDKHWCKKVESLCGLSKVRFSDAAFKYEVVVEVQAKELASHPGITRLIRSTLAFKRVDGIVIMAGPERIAVRINEPAFVRDAAKNVQETNVPLTEELLQRLDENNLPLNEVMGGNLQSAAS